MNYYFIGIKGTGMAALACMLHDLGHHVEGSDLPVHYFTQNELELRHIRIKDFNPDNIEDNTYVIIGNAFLEDFPEVQAARNNPTCTCRRYHEFLGEFLENYHLICISGSHGKTTTTGLLSSMLKDYFPTGYLIGDGTGHIDQTTKYFCLEADEFRRHFISYYPKYAIITNVDIDHVDYFKDDEDYRSAYEEYTQNIKEGLVICGDDKEARKLKINPNIKVIWYGLGKENDLIATNIIETSDSMEFDVTYQNSFYGHFKLPFVGRHLLLNSLGCIGIGILEKMEVEDMEKGLSHFTGVKRRFVVEEDGENIYIDDYAHHPTEVGVTIDTARLRFPNHKLVAIFKPHRASRVLFFADAFAEQLKKADQVYLCDFTSIDDKQDGTDIDITYLQPKIPNSIILTEDEEGAKVLSKEKPAVFLFMSSKDIYWLAEILKKMDK